MNKIPETLMNDDFRQMMRTDIDFSSIKHHSRKHHQRKITDGMTQLLVNTCDRFEKHKDFPVWNVVKFSREFQRKICSNNFHSLRDAMLTNDFSINHHYRVPTQHSKGTTKSVVVPIKKIQMAVDYLEDKRKEKRLVNDEVMIDWNAPYQFHSVDVPSRIRIKTASLEKFADEVKDISERTYQKWNLQMRVSEAIQGDGWIQQDYRESDFGRLVGFNLCSLQTMPKKLLSHILSGCYEVDVNTCALLVLPELYKRMVNKSHRFDAIERYTRHKDIIREEVKDALCCDLEMVKQGFTSIAFGVRKNIKNYVNADNRIETPTLTEIFKSETVAATFKEHPEVKSFWNEMSFIFKHLASATKSSLSQYSKEQRVAYLYQTNEASILRSMMKEIGKRLVVPKHDAIIVNQALSPNELINLQDKVYQDTGFKITLKGKWL